MCYSEDVICPSQCQDTQRSWSDVHVVNLCGPVACRGRRWLFSMDGRVLLGGGEGGGEICLFHEGEHLFFLPILYTTLNMEDKSGCLVVVEYGWRSTFIGLRRTNIW